jgi:two-component system response regulator ResD
MSDKKILVIDDDRNILEMMTIALGRADFQVAVAADGDDGLRMFKADQPDLVIIDIAMPGIDGYEVTERIRGLDEGRGTPIIILTAHDQPVMRDYAQELGADLYMTKPVPPAKLLEQIRALLAR